MGVRLERAKADDEIFEMVDDIISAHYGDLQVFEVAVGIEYAHTDPDDPEPAPPVSFLGVPSPASVRVTSYKLRVWGLPDAVITLDARDWDGRDREQREALLDGMLAYLEVPRDKDGAAKTDDAYRPKLKLTAPDWLLAGHARVLERRGAAAVEAMTFRKALTDHPKLRQLILAFASAGDVSWHGVPENPAAGCEPSDQPTAYAPDLFEQAAPYATITN